jgi:uncharacterized membrane protein YccC
MTLSRQSAGPVLGPNLTELYKSLAKRVAGLLDSRGLVAVIFSLKTFGAALIALFLAFWLGLDEPKWALMTVFIVSQPDSGLVLAKSFFRMLGTIAGALVSTVLVFTFSQYGELFLASLAAWIGLCNFAARTERNFTSYGFLLAGYTAAIIGIPAALNPNGAYSLILARFTEISVGLACAALVSTVILPRELTPLIVARTRALARQAEQLATSAVNSVHRRKDIAAKRLQLVKDLAVAEAMRSSAYFESPEALLLSEALRRRMEAALHLAAVSDATLATSGSSESFGSEHPATLASLISAADDTPFGNGALISRLVPVEARRTLDDALVQLQRSEAAFYLRSPVPTSNVCPRLWSDPLDAALTGIRSALAIIITSAFWFTTAWPSGPTAVISAGVACSLVGAMKQQATVSFALILALLVAALPIFVTVFYIMPIATDFLSLGVALAPLLMICGFIIAVQPLGVFPVVYFAISSNIDNTMRYDAVGFLNNSLAILIGFGIALGLFATFFPENPARLGRRFRGQLFVQLRNLARRRAFTLQEYESALCDHLAMTLEPISDVLIVNECLGSAVAALSAARAIDNLNRTIRKGQLAAEMATEAPRLLRQISKTPVKGGRASLTRSAWTARLLRRRALAMARTAVDTKEAEVLGSVIVDLETLRSGLLKVRQLLPDNSDVR